MSVAKFVDIIHATDQTDWSARNKDAFHSLFGAETGRYERKAEKAIALRAPEMSGDSGVPFAALIHPANPPSGPYGGFSFVIFPVADAPCLVGLGVGTHGLAPDEAILGKPGHARKAQAICAWLNRQFGQGQQIAWAKQDPTRTDLGLPEHLHHQWPAYKTVFDRYGREMYALFTPGLDRQATSDAVTAFLDLTFDERGFRPLKAFETEFERLRTAWFNDLMHSVGREDVRELLKARRFVIIQGPPGTGKTRMALELVADDYGGHGRTIQFHPNTTYESFVGGLAPLHSERELGLQFSPKEGFLLQAALECLKSPTRPYLLHIDEINRADLSKILGEAIFLLEQAADSKREIALQYDFKEPFRQSFSLPPNLHIVGTMNSADRSIALVDVAVRRRFSFVSLWPQMEVVEQYGCDVMQQAFRTLVSIFVEHAPEDAFNLVPGHSYFLEKDDAKARTSLRVNLAPLLEEYLAQGYVGGFSEPIRGYLQWLRSL